MTSPVDDLLPDHGPPPLDRAALLANAGGDEALAAELVALFARETLPVAEGIPGLTDDAEQRAAAHRVRGAALAIGAAELAAVALSIEEGASPGAVGAALKRLRARLAEPIT